MSNPCAGGNVIQLAEVFPHVLGVDICQKRLDMTQHNAAIYGVSSKVGGGGHLVFQPGYKLYCDLL